MKANQMTNMANFDLLPGWFTESKISRNANIINLKVKPCLVFWITNQKSKDIQIVTMDNFTQEEEIKNIDITLLD